MPSIVADANANVDVADNDSLNVISLHYSSIIKGQSNINMERSPNPDHQPSPPVYAVINLTEKYSRRRERLLEEKKSDALAAGNVSKTPPTEASGWTAHTSGEYEEILEYQYRSVTSTVTDECWDSENGSGNSDDDHIYEPINVRSECRVPTKLVSTPKSGRFGGYFKRNRMMDTLWKMCDRRGVKATTAKDEYPSGGPQQKQPSSRLVTEFRKMWPNNQSRRSFKECLTRMCRMKNNADAPKPNSRCDMEQRNPVLPPISSSALEHILAARTKFLQSCLAEANKLDQPRLV